MPDQSIPNISYIDIYVFSTVQENAASIRTALTNLKTVQGSSYRQRWQAPHQLVHLGINHCAIWICEANCALWLHHSNRVGCIISNGVQSSCSFSSTVFQLSPTAEPAFLHLFFFCFVCLFFSAIAPASTTLVSAPHHTTPQLTALTTSDSQNMQSVAFTKKPVCSRRTAYCDTSTPCTPSLSLSFFPLCPSLVSVGFFSLEAASALMRSTKMLAGLLHSSLPAPFFSSDNRGSRPSACRQRDPELNVRWGKQ